MAIMKIIIILESLVLIIGVSLLMGLPTMWLWNWLMPDIFNITEITFLQAVGLNLLSDILFKNINSYSKKNNKYNYLKIKPG
jgi:hypothetical protein